MSDTAMTTQRAVASSTAFINLIRGGKATTRMGWKSATAGTIPTYTSDYSAVVAGLDLTDLPDDLKPNSKYTVPLDCSIRPFLHWVLASPTHQLCEQFSVNMASMYPPGSQSSDSVIPTVTLVTKHGLKKAEITKAAVYLALLS